MENTTLPPLLIAGLFLLIGWGAHALGSLTHVPRVTLLLTIGILAGPSVLNIMPPYIEDWFPAVANLALAMVGFLLGESLLGRDIKISAKTVLVISIGVVIGAASVVFLAIYLLTDNLPLALVLGGIATATAPAATIDVVHEYQAKGELTSTLLGVVAIDDAWGVILFSLLLVTAEIVSGNGTNNSDLLHGLWDVGGGILLGVCIGFPMAWLVGRIKPGEPTLTEASGFVLLCAGLAQYFEVSYLLACMSLGATVALRAKHHTRPFREIEGASEPFLVIFFLLAGHELDLNVLTTIGTMGVAYICARILGKVLGAQTCARLVKAPEKVRKHIGWCMLPQAGIALGLALLVTNRLPELGEIVLPLVIATTVVFELFGPIVTRQRLQKANEIT